jgi:hypothetical protein
VEVLNQQWSALVMGTGGVRKDAESWNALRR